MPESVFPMPPSADDAKSLQISASPQQALTPAQQAFNQWIAKIAALRAEVMAEQQKLEALRECADKHLVPAYRKIARAKVELAMALEQAVLTNPVGKRQQQEIGTCIAALCRQAFAIIDPSAEEVALQDRWTDKQKAAFEADGKKAQLKEILETQLEDVLGDEEDWEAWKDDPERLQKMMDALEEKRAQAAEKARSQGKTASKPRKPGGKEALAQAAEALKSRSVRTLYISLAKLLHPDMEPEPSLRAAKEELMKKVIAAYDQNDLATLLTMEMDWIHQQNNHLGKVPEDKLGLYVEVLKDQAQALAGEKADLFWEPRYRLVQPYSQGRLDKGLRTVKAHAAELTALHKELSGIVRSIREGNRLAEMVSRISDMLAWMGTPE